MPAFKIKLKRSVINYYRWDSYWWIFGTWEIYRSVEYPDAATAKQDYVKIIIAILKQEPFKQNT